MEEVVTTSTAQLDTAAVDTVDTQVTQEAPATEVAEAPKEETQEVVKEVAKEEVKEVPGEYGEFTLPEGFEAPIPEFKEWAKAEGMNQKQAQSALDFYTSKVVPAMQASHDNEVKAWGEQASKEFGDKGIDSANKAVAKFATPEFKEFLNSTGLGNHPEMIRVFKNIASVISESSLITGVSTPANSKENYYPGLPQNKKG